MNHSSTSRNTSSVPQRQQTGVPVGVLLDAVEDALLAQAVVDELVDLEDALAREPVEAVYEGPEVVEGGDNRQPFPLAYLEVLLARAGGGVDDSRPLRLLDLLPRYDPVVDAFLNRQFVEGPLVPQPHQVGARHLLQHVMAGAQFGQPRPEEVEDFAVLGAGLGVGEIRVYVGRRIGGQRPGGGRPHKERLVFAADQRESDV